MLRTLFLVILSLSTDFMYPMLPEIKEGDWAELMRNEDGVIIESDPDSANLLPEIEQSYFPLKPIKNTHSFVSHSVNSVEQKDLLPTDNSPRVLTKVKDSNFQDLIISEYPENMDAEIAKMHIVYTIHKKNSLSQATNIFGLW